VASDYFPRYPTTLIVHTDTIEEVSPPKNMNQEQTNVFSRHVLEDFLTAITSHITDQTLGYSSIVALLIYKYIENI